MQHVDYERRVRRGFTAMIALIGCIIFAGFWLSQEREMMYYWVTNARAVRTVIRELRAKIIEAESNERGYVLTGRAQYSRIYDQSCLQVRGMLWDLQRLSAGNVHHQQMLPELNSDVNRWIEVSRRVIELRREGSASRAERVIASASEASTLSRITDRLRGMYSEEDRLLNARTQTWNAYSRYLAWAIHTLAFVLLGLIWLAYRALRTAGKNHAMFRAATEGSMDGFLLLEPVRRANGKITDFVVLDANHRARAITGKVAGRMVGRRLTHVLPLALRECMVDRYVRAIEGSQVLEEEFPVDPARPEVRWIRHQVVPVENGLAVTFRDVTEQKNQELQLITQQSELMTANSRLEALAITDYLTDLKNNRAFHEKLEEEVHRADRYDEPLSLIMMDVDRFKQYNDTFGHPAGDDALREIADILKANVRATDFVARYGGEEFAVILPQTDHLGALEAAERFRSAIKHHDWSRRGLTASVGAATFHKAMGGAARLVDAADKAMYAAKTAGRNRVRHADDSHRTRIPRRPSQQIRLAI